MGTRGYLHLFSALIIVLVLCTAAQSATLSAIIGTNLGDYAPGDTVYITGAGFWAGNVAAWPKAAVAEAVVPVHGGEAVLELDPHERALEAVAAGLKAETVPVRFMILGREGGRISARIKLYDLGGNELAVLEKDWPGSTLYIDVLMVPARRDRDSGKAQAWLAFPYRLFTDKLAAASGSLPRACRVTPRR